MVASKTSVNPNKRKKAADMGDSPPKRVTRSRAKMTEITEPEPPIKTTKITTASAKAAVAKSGPKKLEQVKAMATTKQKTRTNDAADNGFTEQVILDVSKAEDPVQAKTRNRRKKASEEEEQLTRTMPASKTRARVEKIHVDMKPAIEIAPTTKARAPAPKGTRATTLAVSRAENDKSNSKVTKKATRGTSASSASAKISTASSTIAKAPVARKKVTFQETSEQNKENEPIVASKRSGIGAKPLRKPAATKPTTRRGKAAPANEAAQDDGVERAKPLSPKKVSQVAKSISSEDELAVEKTPVKLLAQSPRKPPISVLKETVSTTLNTSSKVSSESVLAASSLMASPARRPPPSPFKGAIKESPKKLDFGSPKKFIFGTSAVGTSVPQQQNALQASLLQSPAKRPTSPTRSFASVSPNKNLTDTESQEQAPDTTRRSTLKVTRFTPHKALNTLLRATHTEPHSVQAHDACLLQGVEEDEISPGKSGNVLEILSLNGESIVPPNFNEESTTPPGTPQFALLGAQSVYNTPMPTKSVEQIEAQDLTDDTTLSQGEQVKESVSSTSDNSDKRVASSVPSSKCPSEQHGQKHLPATFRLEYGDSRLQPEESDSEDELQSTFKPGSLQSYPHETIGTPTPLAVPHKPRTTLGRSSFHTTMTSANDGPSMTPLATQLSAWLASSPDKKAPRINQSSTRNVFSPVGLRLFGQLPQPTHASRQASPFKSVSPLKSSFFEEEMMVLDQEETVVEVHEDEQVSEENGIMFEVAQGSFESSCSTASDQYADEDALPIDPRLLQEEANGEAAAAVVIETCTPARIFYSNPHEIHTVSKVPLRPPADDSPDLFPRQRSRSLSSPSKSRGIFKDLTHLKASVEGSQISRSPEGTVVLETNVECLITPHKSEQVAAANVPLPVTPSGGTWSNFTTPVRSGRKGSDAQILRGSVIYVDVHTTEGADASAIFVELLTSIGARCVKQWNWNPRASLGSSLDTAIDGQDPPSGTPGNKVGITHVVFKDGGKRTLEKVRESNGLVSCVGVGWVLNCEQQNKWVDETEYAVDLSLIPRGGHRRRKSMEPGRLSNLNGNLIPADFTPAKPNGNSMSPTKEFLNLSSPPSSRRETLGPDSPIFQQQFLGAERDDHADKTPSNVRPETPPGFRSAGAGSSFGSPTTPFYLGREADLLQKTCPPKQKFQSILQGDDDDEERVRQRLLQARRKTLQWAPRVESPLGRWGGN